MDLRRIAEASAPARASFGVRCVAVCPQCSAHYVLDTFDTRNPHPRCNGCGTPLLVGLVGLRNIKPVDGQPRA